MCQTFFNKASLIQEDDVNDEMSNGIPKTSIPSNGVVNWGGVLKLGGRPKGDHATRL
jgi:hypothetical protein